MQIQVSISLALLAATSLYTIVTIMKVRWVNDITPIYHNEDEPEKQSLLPWLFWITIITNQLKRQSYYAYERKKQLRTVPNLHTRYIQLVTPSVVVSAVSTVTII
jgi:hypothetical protein